MSKKIKVLIVDDSALIRKLFYDILSADSSIEVVGTAEDPLDAREKIKQLNPDVVTLDIEMPKMDGLSFLEKIMTLRPTPVIMVSTLTHRGTKETLRALELGAIDCIAKPQGSSDKGFSEISSELVSKVKIAARAKVKEYTKTISTGAAKSPTLNFTGNSLNKIIAIGSSTGGVPALGDILPVLPNNTPPVVIVQHIQENFVSSLVKRLNGICEVEVVVAEHLQPLKSGHVYFAPGNKHMEVIKKNGVYVSHLQDEDPVLNHKPSVNVLFDSLVEFAGKNVVSVILTGMGKDGAEGMLALKNAGAITIGQDEASCIVYGMPKAANNLGAVQIQLPLNKIAEEILSQFS